MMSDTDSLDHESLRGVVLKQKYLLIQEIGKGHYATVWLTFDLNCHKCFATKVYDVEYTEEGQNEIMAQARASGSKYLLTAVEMFEHEDYVCLVFPLMGGNLLELSKLCRLTLQQVNYVTQFLLQGVLDLQKRNVYHLDIKPENILFYGDGDLEKQVLTAVGGLKNKQKIKKKLLESTFVKTPTFVSDDLRILITDIGGSVTTPEERPLSTTKYYEPPESKFGLAHSVTSDVWAIGCIRYELLTGDLLFDIDSDCCEVRQYFQFLFKYCGQVPTHLIPATLSIAYFRQDGGIKGVEKLSYYPPADEFVRRTLVIDMIKRPTLETLLSF